MWIIAGLGIICCITAMIVGFIPPTQLPIGNVFIFELLLLSGLGIFVVIPWFITKKD